MKLNKPITPEDYKLQGSFKSVCQQLLEKRYTERWEKPLAYWALPDDRGLPMALLGHKIGDLLSTPFDELSGTPGVGRKKIKTLVTLLNRVAKDDASNLEVDGADTTKANGKTNGKTNGKSKNGKPEEKFDPANVSEAVWTRWRDTVRRNALGREKLGYLAPSLRKLPTVIWRTPLDYYLDRSLTEINSLKTHGEKRVHAVLKVFHTLHQMLSTAGTDQFTSLRPTPKFVVAIENWIDEVSANDGPPGQNEIRCHVVLPILEQIRHDCGETLYKLIADRLGVDGRRQSVRTQSKRMGVTRARVYQLLEDGSKVLNVRWPQGRCYMAQLAEQVEDVESQKMLKDLREIVFPEQA